MRLKWIGIVLLGLCLPGLLWAQKDSAQLRELEAEILYKDTARLMERGQYDKALRRFSWLVSGYEASKYAVLARERQVGIRHLEETKIHISPPARAGLVVFSSLYMTWLGVGAGIMLENPETTFFFGMIAGPVAGITVGLGKTRDAPLSDGQASLLALGGAWGTWQGIGAALLADSGYKTVIGASLGGGALGLLASAAIIQQNYVSTGEATMINFGGIWGTWLALCGAKSMGITKSDAVLASAMVGGNIGLLGMGGLAPGLGMSGARARLINLGGIVGSLYGLGTAILAEVDHRARPTFGLMLGGSVLGLGAGAWFTRGYDGAPWFFTPQASGALLQAGWGGVGVGIPLPRVDLLPEPAPSNQKRQLHSELRIGLLDFRF